DFAAFMPNAQKPNSAPASAKKLEFGTISKEFQTMTPAFGGFGTPELKISKELRAQLQHPEKFDPLSFVYGEGLALIADQRKLNIVANIPDTVEAGMMAFMQGGAPELTDSALLDRLSSGACKSVQADGWLTVSPTDPTSAIEAHIDRSGLAQIIKVAHERGTPTLDEISEYAKASPDPVRSPLSMKYFQLAPTMLSQSASGMVRWDVIKFYGLLGRDARNLVRNGQPLGLQTIPAAASTVLKKLLFGSGAKFITEKTANLAKDGNLMTRAMEMFANSTPTILDEPTEIMPSGLPPRGFLKIIVSADSVVMPVGADGEAAGGVMGPEEVALYRFIQDDQTFGQQIPVKQNFDRLQVGDRTKLDLRIYVERDILSQFELQDYAMKRDSKSVGLGGTPKEFQAQVDKLMADYKKNGLPFGMNGGVRANP
ncbi:MAG: hypothetical protein K8R88_14855, partial [Armatimonadetes bacterium]|nr:hypothetical protein [Armatimonadota bacterium]